MLPCFDGSLQDGTYGFYIIGQQQIWKSQPSDPNDDKGISLFAQYGQADASVSAVGHHVGVGISAVGLVPGRDNDDMGIYWTWVDLSHADGAGFTRNESSLEMYYKCQILQFISVRPDLQYIQNPGGTTAVKLAWVGTVRVVLDF
jgi:porin